MDKIFFILSDGQVIAAEGLANTKDGENE